MSAVTTQMIYSVRYLPHKLPESILSRLLSLPTVPAPYKAFRGGGGGGGKKVVVNDNWRRDAYINVVRMVREKGDPDYEEINSCLNKVAQSSLFKLTDKIIEILKKNDEMFRLRVMTLIFDFATRNDMSSTLMSQISKRICDAIPESSEDVKTQIDMFPEVYDMNKTVTIDSKEDDFSEARCEYVRLRNRRKEYASFMMKLVLLGLVDVSVADEWIAKVLGDIAEVAKQPKTPQTEENTVQLIEFLFQISTKLTPEMKLVKDKIAESLRTILATPRTELPSLNTRTKFKIEDTLKNCV
jgi:hypothetical protein